MSNDIWEGITPEWVERNLPLSFTTVLAGRDLPDDIRECCEVLRESVEDIYGLHHNGLGLCNQTDAATWQLLDYLGVL